MVNLVFSCLLAGTPALAMDEAAEPTPPKTHRQIVAATDPEWEPKARVTYSNFLALRVNPLGLLERLRIGYQHRLIPNNDGALFKGAMVNAGVEFNLPPTYGAFGPRIEIRPLTILGFEAKYEFIGYFGIIDAVMPMASTQDDFWETTLDQRGANGENTAAFGSRLTLSADVVALYKGFLIRNQVQAVRLELNLPGGEPAFYDATQDLVFPNGGFAILNDLDVGGLIKKKVAVGVRYSYADALHDGAGGPGDLPMHRIGPLVAWTIHDRPAGARFDRPTLLALIQWYPQHPYRSGQEQSAAIPYFALAWQFQGDLWTSKK